MKLYEFKPAPNPRRVRIFMAEKGIDAEFVPVDLPAGEHRTQEFAKLNPTLDLPVLQLDDGTCIHQVDAICRYLEEVYPENPLWGRDALERASVNAWNHQIFLNGWMAVVEAYRNTAAMFVGRGLSGPHDYPQSAELAQRGLMRIPNFFADMDKHFATHKFVVGDYFSVADIQAMVAVDFAKWVKQGIQEEQIHLKRWYEEVSSRPSAKA